MAEHANRVSFSGTSSRVASHASPCQCGTWWAYSLASCAHAGGANWLQGLWVAGPLPWQPKELGRRVALEEKLGLGSSRPAKYYVGGPGRLSVMCEATKAAAPQSALEASLLR
jgi:hypothetical protein